jgi:alpha-2-macroglobulin
MRITISLFCVAFLSAMSSVRAQSTLAVVNAQPSGEISNLAQAAEIRVRFSEPMVPIGRIAGDSDRVTAPFFSVRPSIAGTFRWAGPTILVFTPDPKTPLPNATRYDATIDSTATAVSGRRLAHAFTFTFTTPTAHLLETSWYRSGGRFDRPVVIALRFNQAVRPADVAAHLTAQYAPHQWRRPNVSDVERARMLPEDAARFDAKVTAAAAVAASQTPIPLRVAADWDKKRFPPSPDLVVLETVSPPASQGWIRLALDDRLPAVDGGATPSAQQAHTVQLEPTLFVDGFDCRIECNADDYNVARVRAAVPLAALRRAATVRDITDAAQPTLVQRLATPRETYRSRQETIQVFNFEDLGFDSQTPARTWAVTVDASLTAVDGQVLGYTWTGVVENWHQRAFASFGDGHGVWETGGGPLPFYARNFTSALQWLRPLAPNELMPTILELDRNHFRGAWPGSPGPTERALGVTPDRIQSHGLNLSDALTPSGTGLVWAAVQPRQPIARARPMLDDHPIASIVQVTNLGITVKDSPESTLVFVTRLDTGTPVGGANVSIVRLDNSVAWSGRTGGDGIAIAPAMRLRNQRRWWQLAFIVTAAKDGDIAYVGSDWHEGIEPFAFGARYDLNEAQPPLRGTVFSDRGVYKLGEEVHVKAVLRRDTASGIQLIPAGTLLHIEMRDSRDKIVDQRSITMSTWSTAEWVVRVPIDGTLGTYRMLVSLDKKALEPATPRPPENDEPEDVEAPWLKIVQGNFLVAAYRRPDFRVDATLGGDSTLAGSTLKGVVSARYLFGASMTNRPVAWTFSRSPVASAPAAVLKAFPADRFQFVGCCDPQMPFESVQLAAKTATLNAAGQLAVDLETSASDGMPYEYRFEGDVEDVSRQHIAGHAAFLVHPAPWYIGLKRPSMFVEQKDGVATAIVAVSADGTPVAGLKVDVSLVEVQWHSVRRAEGNGFYTWDTERKEVDAGHFSVTTTTDPVPLSIPLKNGGAYLLRATAADGTYKSITRLSFYAIGSGYTAWARYDHNRIDLVPERESYKPGETARLMIQSPWEHATALLTVEREGIRSHSTFALTSTQQTVSLPISAVDIPNLFVSVLLIKGRTDAGVDASDTSDPGKPAFRVGYAKLKVEDSSKRLSVDVKANHDEFRPAGSAKVQVTVKDAQGAPASGEVTLWAVDYGVLSLTGFRTPDVLASVYVPKALQVMTEDNRQRIVSRRVLTPKGSAEGGGGGEAESGVSEIRKDFRVLAFWLGSVVTDSKGTASVDVRLPESLTTYRIMAVAGDKASRFGAGDSEIRINKPVVLKAAFPRFMTRGDHAFFGSVVTSQLKQPGSAIVTMRSLDPDVLQIAGDARRIVDIAAGGSTEVRFDVVAKAIGRARVQTTVRIGSESDAFEDSIPIEVAVSPESMATYGEAAPSSKQPFAMPTGIVPGFGGLHLEVSSTALVGLGEGARYVVEYPFGCVEQRASRAFVMAVASDLGDTFHLPGVDAKDLRPRVQAALRELEKFQCPSGGFALWPGACQTQSPYLTSYVLHVYQTAASLKYDADKTVLARGYDYLEHAMAREQPVNEGWWPAYTAWESFAVKVLVEGSRNQDSNINRLYAYLDRMPVFALAYLRDAMLAKGESGARPTELQRRMANAMLPEAGSIHVEELADPYLLYFWNSNVRSTAIALNTLTNAGEPQGMVSGLVRWLLAARQNGRWGNTQENATAMQALVAYYRKYESVTPNFTATIKLGTQDLLRETFKGRSTVAATKEVPMAQLARTPPAGDLTVTRDGEGTAFYTMRLTYAPDAALLQSLDNGFRVGREYAPLRDGRAGTPGTSFSAGELVRVTLSLDLPKERRFVAVTDPLPAGFEPVESWFATTARDVARAPDDAGDDDEPSWMDVWRRGTFDHVERHDDRVLVFATRLSEGHHEFSYVVRATTAGVFQVAPARVEMMYEPEVSGRTSTETVEIKR